MQIKKPEFSFDAKSAFDYQLLAAIAILALMSSVFVGADFTRPAQVLSLIASNLFAFTVLFFFVFVTKKFVLFLKVEKFSLATVTLYGAVVGMAKGALTGIGMVWAGVEPGLLFSISSRVWQTLMIGLLLIPAAAFLANLRHRFSLERESLLSERVRRESSDSYYSDSLREIVALAKTKLRSATSIGDKEHLAAQVRDIVSNQLRPLSHEIWAREAKLRPGYGFKSLINEAIIKEVYRPVLVPLLWMITTFIPYILFFGYPDGAALSLARSLALVVIFLIAGKIRVRTVRTAWLKFALVVFAAMLIHQYLNELVVGYPAFPLELLGIPVSNMIWIAELMLLSGMIRVFIARGKDVRSALNELVGSNSDMEVWQKQAMMQDRALAQFLHGHLQSRLMATAIRLEQERGVQTLPEDIDLVERVLEDSIARFSNPKNMTLREMEKELLKSWSGLIELEINLRAKSAEVRQVNTIYEVVDEAITNALRHGFAEKISVDIAQEANSFVITIIDDGTGPRSGQKGLGSYFFDSVALDWRLARGDEVGSVLRVTLAG